MKNSISVAFISAVAMTFAFAGSDAKAQSTPVQQAQPPQQSEQSREQDRSRAEDVKIGRDWKAQGGEKDHAGQPTPDEQPSDWRSRLASPSREPGPPVAIEAQLATLGAWRDLRRRKAESRRSIPHVSRLPDGLL